MNDTLVAETWYVYILQCSDDTLYTGITNDLDKRVDQHNYGTTAAKYTRARRPVQLVYFEQLADKRLAAKREYEIKQLTRAEKLVLIQSG